MSPLQRERRLLEVKKDYPDKQFMIHKFLGWYAQFLIWFFLSVPWLVLAWYCFSQYLAGAPEPEYWLTLKSWLFNY
jgi:hypothetical protein